MSSKYNKIHNKNDQL